MYRTAVRGDMRISQGIDAISCIFGSKTMARRQRTWSWRAMRGRSTGVAGLPEDRQRPVKKAAWGRKHWSAGRTGHLCAVAAVLQRSRGIGARGMPTAPGPATAGPRRCVPDAVRGVFVLRSPSLAARLISVGRSRRGGLTTTMFLGRSGKAGVWLSNAAVRTVYHGW